MKLFIYGADICTCNNTAAWKGQKKNVEIDVFKQYNYNWLYCTSLTPRHEYVSVNIGGMLRMKIFKVN